MAHFPSDFLDELLTRTDLAELISRHVNLKPAGANLVGLCPFHNEKSPSFSVSVDKQMYYCFGCGKGGNAFRFLMDHSGYPFPEAVEFLAQKAGIPMPISSQSDNKESSQKKQDYEILDQVAGVFARTLQSDEGKQAREYFAKRKLPDAIIQKYQLGFAPAGYGFMQRCFGNEPKILKQLEAIGILIHNERGYADRFRNRIIFPIRDKKGQVCGFGGRIMGDEQPKYLNSPETEYYHKSHLLYGLSEHRDAIRRDKTLVVVEGYMDVLAMAAHELPYGLAPLGTAITESQLRTILQLHPSPVFCFDGDRAGKQAAWRAIDRMLPILKAEHSPRFLYLPDGEDPDSLLQKEGKDAFAQRLTNEAKPALETWLQGLRNIAGSGAEGRARMAKKADQMLGTMSDHYLRQAWQGEVEKVSGVTLQQQEPIKTRAPGRATFTPKQRQTLSVPKMTSDLFMSALLQKPNRFHQLPNDSLDFFIDSDPMRPLYTRAFSLADDEENTEDIAAQLMREYPDNPNIARWVNLPEVEDNEFQELVINMHLAYLDGLGKQSVNLAVKNKIQVERMALRAELEALKKVTQQILISNGGNK